MEFWEQKTNGDGEDGHSPVYESTWSKQFRKAEEKPSLDSGSSIAEQAKALSSIVSWNNTNNNGVELELSDIDDDDPLEKCMARLRDESDRLVADALSGNNTTSTSYFIETREETTTSTSWVNVEEATEVKERRRIKKILKASSPSSPKMPLEKKKKSSALFKWKKGQQESNQEEEPIAAAIEEDDEQLLAIELENRRKLKESKQKKARLKLKVVEMIETRNSTLTLRIFRSWKKRARQSAARLKIKKNCIRVKHGAFSAWNSTVLRARKRRETAGNIQCWILTSFVMRIWKSETTEAVAVRHEQLLIESKINSQHQQKIASEFYTKSTLKRFITSWQAFTDGIIESRFRENQKRRRREKAQQLLEHLAQQREEKLQQQREEKLQREEEASAKQALAKKKMVRAEAKEEKKLERTEKLETTRRKVKAIVRPKSTQKAEAKASIVLKKVEEKSHDTTTMSDRIEKRKAARNALKKKYEEAERVKRIEADRAIQEAAEAEEKLREEARLAKVAAKAERQAIEHQKELERRVRKQKLELAKLHYLRNLLKNYGLERLKEAAKIRRLKLIKATRWFNDRNLQKCFDKWTVYLSHVYLEKARVAQEKHARACEMHQLSVFETHFFQWRKICTHRRKMIHWAETHYRLGRQDFYFAAWFKYHQECFLIQRKKEQHVRSHLIKTRLRYILSTWKIFVRDKQELREYEREKDEVWDDVRSWLGEK